MSLGNTTARYGTVSKTLHWLTAGLILTVIPLGLIANGIAEDIRTQGITNTAAQASQAALLFSLHKTLGLTIFAVALVRIAWAVSQPKPAPLNPERWLEALTAKTVHWLLYGSLVLVPLSGWIHHAATTGFAPIWWPFGQSLPFVSVDEGTADLFARLHRLLERVLLVALGLHIVGALKHHFVDRDPTLARMWPGNGDAAISPQPLSTRHRSSLPPIIALAIWASALGVGYFTSGFFDSKTHPPTAEALDAVLSQWQVTDGTIQITITQLGSPVTGQFADWTAAITYDDIDAPGPAGSVKAQIAIGSLTLGSVTDQAKGADFLDVANHPTATFSARIDKTATGHLADGTLTLRGIALPLTLPFLLEIEGDTARMTGSTDINRLDYGVGETTADEATLGYGVHISVALTAQRQPVRN